MEFGLSEVVCELQTRLFCHEAAVFAEETGVEPATGLLRVVIESLQAEIC